MNTLRSTFVSLVTVLLGIGVLMVFSSSMTARPSNFEQVYLSRHLIYLAIACSGACLVAMVPPRQLLALAPLGFGATLLMLLAVLVPGVGVRVNGSQRWLRLATISIQPSELAKVTLPLYLCWLSLRIPTAETVLRRYAILSIPIGLCAALVVVEPDLGTAVFLATIGGTTLFLLGMPIRLIGMAAAAVVPLGLGMVALKPYQLRRIEGFIQAWNDFQNAPYQVKQSLTTLGAGGVNGVGLGRGSQKLSFLPEANTDFVFAVVGEELGLVGTLSVVGIWCAILVVGLLELSRAGRPRTRFVAAAVVLLQLVAQAAINIAVVTAMLPPKGIAHPLLSAGGSSLVGSLLAVGVFLSMSREEIAAAQSAAKPDTASAALPRAA